MINAMIMKKIEIILPNLEWARIAIWNHCFLILTVASRMECLIKVWSKRQGQWITLIRIGSNGWARWQNRARSTFSISKKQYKTQMQRYLKRWMLWLKSERITNCLSSSLQLNPCWQSFMRFLSNRFSLNWSTLSVNLNSQTCSVTFKNFWSVTLRNFH